MPQPRRGGPATRTYLEVCQQPYISRDLMCRCAEARQRCQDVDVDFTGIRLGCDRIGILEPTQLGDTFIQSLYFRVVPIKESQETGLSTRGSFSTTEPEVVSCPFDVPKVPKEFLPQMDELSVHRLYVV
jgi:hypothetical protein